MLIAIMTITLIWVNINMLIVEELDRKFASINKEQD